MQCHRGMGRSNKTIFRLHFKGHWGRERKIYFSKSYFQGTEVIQWTGR